MKWKWRNDRRSERNSRNCVKKPEKKNSGLLRGLNPWPRDTGVMLYQLSYEATDVGSTSIVVLERLLNAGFRLNKAKCKFFQSSVVYLGHVIDGEGLHPSCT